MTVSSITKLFFLLLCGMVFSGCTSTKTETAQPAPLWAEYETLARAFPPEEYIARLGSADTADSARVKADAELSAYFSQTVSMSTAADERVSSDGTKDRQSRTLALDIKVSSRQELLALRHTEPYFDRARKSYVVCAYINREEAWILVEPKLKSLAAKFENAYQNSRSETELLQKILLLQSIQRQSPEFYDLYGFARGIAPQKAESFSSTDELIQTAAVENRRLKQNAGILVRVSGDETGRVRTKVGELLRKSGFLLAEKNALYTTNVSVSAEGAENGAAFISYPQVSVEIERAGGTVLASYAKQMEKVSAYTKEAAVRMALHTIETELERSFLRDCLNE